MADLSKKKKPPMAPTDACPKCCTKDVNLKVRIEGVDYRECAKCGTEYRRPSNLPPD